MLINRLTCPLPLGWSADDPIIFIFSVAMASNYVCRQAKTGTIVGMNPFNIKLLEQAD